MINLPIVPDLHMLPEIPTYDIISQLNPNLILDTINFFTNIVRSIF